MKKTILYPGSFNPIHKGHIAIAAYVIENGLCDEIRLIVSPQNPLKLPTGIAPEADRLEMAKIAVQNSIYANKIVVDDIEFNLKKPSYTIDTLEVLWRNYPDTEFSILMGEDNIADIEKWKNFLHILDNCKIYVYSRRGFCEQEHFLHKNIIPLANAELLDVSSTMIRKTIAEKQNTESLLDENVKKYIIQHKLYETD